MRTLLSLALLALGSAFVFGAGACDAPPERRAEVATPGPVLLPPSAVTAAVRALEALDASRAPDTLVELRALEASALEHGPSGSVVRVFLHLTVFAATSERARLAFDELRAVLEGEARTPLDPAPVATERVQRVFGAKGWTPVGSEELLSYSDALRLEYGLAPGAHAGGGRGGDPGAEPERAAPDESVAIADYVREQASAAGLARLPISVRPSMPAPGVEELRAFLRDDPDSAGHPRAALGAFLGELENESPAARVTELRIEHSQNAPDPHAERSWTFEALLVVRVPGG